MSKVQDTYNAINDYLKENPTSNPSRAAKELGLNVANYYSKVAKDKIREKKVTKVKTSPKPKSEMQVLKVPEVSVSPRTMIIVTDDVRSVMQQLWG